jgi:hypothetical protein
MLAVPGRTGNANACSLEFITALRGKSENVHVVNMFTTALRKVAPAIVIANPRVTSPQQARASGKPVLFLFGNIHPRSRRRRKHCRWSRVTSRWARGKICCRTRS